MDKIINLKPKELEATRHIRDCLVHHGRAPSIRELMRKLEYKSPRSVQDLLDKLEYKKIILRTKTGNIQLKNDPESTSSHAQTVSVPIVGTVSCGSPIWAEENIEGYVAVSTSIIKKGSKYFLLHASGDSMNMAGINDGDLALVRQQPTAQNGDKVVALIDDEATIKEYRHAGNSIILQPKSTNLKHFPIILTDDFQIQGVVENVISNTQ
ncbi:transcriptional repressor LexA [Patescibacteria group bacterium]|nr:transcriptional repressor LexA [Patescibacteria group bacterium]